MRSGNVIEAAPEHGVDVTMPRAKALQHVIKFPIAVGGREHQDAVENMFDPRPVGPVATIFGGHEGAQHDALRLRSEQASAGAASFHAGSNIVPVRYPWRKVRKIHRSLSRLVGLRRLIGKPDAVAYRGFTRVAAASCTTPPQTS